MLRLLPAVLCRLLGKSGYRVLQSKLGCDVPEDMQYKFDIEFADIRILIHF